MKLSCYQRKGLLIILLLYSLHAPAQEKASPFQDAVQVWNFDGYRGLKTNGAVRLGVRLTGEERTASLESSGDGYVAEFNGGWLETASGIQVTGKQMTLLVRAKDLTKTGKGILLARRDNSDPYANLLYGSSLDTQKLGFRERARMKDGRSIEFQWQTNPLAEQASSAFLSDSANNPYKISTDSAGKSETWTQALFPQIYPALKDGILKVAAPMELVGTEGWHDILVRFTGPKLQLFIDGVLTDEEYPHGDLLRFQSPFLIGAGYLQNTISSVFRGLIDHIAIWDRALTDSEIANLCGGEATIAARRRQIQGEENEGLQYWRPPGYNEFVGDPMPFFHDGTLHLFYLLDRKHHRLRWGAGVHPWGHRTSRDLTHWKTLPRAIDITDPRENALGTGNVLFHEGTYYLYWVNHGRRLVFKDAPEHYLSDNIYLATSTDGIHFNKEMSQPVVRINYQYSGDVNPFVWKSASGNRFYMYISGPPPGGNWYFESDDLRNWCPVKLPALDNVHAACCSYYHWKDHYYWFDWTKEYRSSTIPIEEHGAMLKKVGSLTEAWGVPQAVPFTGNRMLMVGFTIPNNDYGGMALVRELVNNNDGTLGLKWPAEMVPASGSPVRFKIQRIRGDLSGNINSFRLAAGKTYRGAVGFADKIPANIHLSMRIVPGAEASEFGVVVRGSGEYQNGQELCFDPEKKQFRYAIAPYGRNVPASSGSHGPNMLENVEGLDKPFQLDVIVRDDFVDVCIDNRYTLFHQRPEDFFDGNRLFFFVRKGSVKFESITVRPLKD